MLQTAPLLGDRGSRTRWMNSVSEQGSILRECCLGTLLGIEQHRTSSKVIKLSVIRPANQDAGEAGILRPGSRYAIFKITNGIMTAHKGLWTWTAQEVR